MNPFSLASRAKVLRERHLGRHWDILVLQDQSFNPVDRYEDFLAGAKALQQLLQPEKLLLYQTWAYEDGSDRLYNVAHFGTAAEMFAAVEDAYAFAAQTIGADGIIPSGKLFRSLLDNGIEKIHSDTYHASLGLGRYALGLLWYRTLTGNSVAGNDFHHFDVPIPEEQSQIAKKCVDSL